MAVPLSTATTRILISLFVIGLVLLAVFLPFSTKTKLISRFGTQYAEVPNTGYTVGTDDISYGNLSYNIGDVAQCEFSRPGESLFCSDGSRRYCSEWGCTDSTDPGSFSHPDRHGVCNTGSKQCVRSCCKSGYISSTTQVQDLMSGTSASASSYLA